jgi:hypothetical protein
VLKVLIAPPFIPVFCIEIPSEIQLVSTDSWLTEEATIYIERECLIFCYQPLTLIKYFKTKIGTVVLVLQNPLYCNVTVLAMIYTELTCHLKEIEAIEIRVNRL